MKIDWKNVTIGIGNRDPRLNALADMQQQQQAQAYNQAILNRVDTKSVADATTEEVLTAIENGPLGPRFKEIMAGLVADIAGKQAVINERDARIQRLEEELELRKEDMKTMVRLPAVPMGHTIAVPRVRPQVANAHGSEDLVEAILPRIDRIKYQMTPTGYKLVP